MKWVKAVVAIWLLASFAIWARSGSHFSAFDALPFVVREQALDTEYELFACVMVGLFVWGYLRLQRGK